MKSVKSRQVEAAMEVKSGGAGQVRLIGQRRTDLVPSHFAFRISVVLTSTLA